MVDQLEVLLRLADRHSCGIDLHIDESDHGPAEGMVQLLKALRRVPVQVPVTCSHASSPDCRAAPSAGSGGRIHAATPSFGGKSGSNDCQLILG